MKLSDGAGRSVKALAVACSCIELGARWNTVAAVTGLSKRVVHELMARARRPRAMGRLPTCSDHLFLNNQIRHLEISVVLGTYWDLVQRGNEPAESLVVAYRMYLARFGSAYGKQETAALPGDVLTFDRVFDFASRTFALWGVARASLMLVRCDGCHSRFVSTRIAPEVKACGCPFCRVGRRYRANDQKVRRYLDEGIGPSAGSSVGMGRLQPVASGA